MHEEPARDEPSLIPPGRIIPARGKSVNETPPRGPRFPQNVEKVADLPTREQALAQLMGVLKAPIGKFVRTVAEPHAKLVRTIAAVKDQKQAAA